MSKWWKNSGKKKSAQFIQKIIKRLTQHSFPSAWHYFISAFYFYSHLNDQSSCYAQQPVKMCCISKSGMLCSSFSSKPTHFNRTSELKLVFERKKKQRVNQDHLALMFFMIFFHWLKKRVVIMINALFNQKFLAFCMETYFTVWTKIEGKHTSFII